MGIAAYFKGLFRTEGGTSQQSTTGVMYRGYLITPTPQRSGGEFYTCGLISKPEEAADTRQARFIRADRHGSLEQAQQHAIQKGKQIIDEQGDALFERDHL
jgi:hypothetical protein